MHRQATFMLQFRLLEQQAEAAEKQAKAAEEGATATENLVVATRALAGFTRALVRVTWTLFIVGGGTLAIAVVQALITLKLIGR